MASEEKMFNSPAPETKATWTPSFHKVFIDLCLEETAKGNRPGTHFTKEGWKNIQEAFHRETGMRYDKIQIKNHWDTTKEHWRIWHKIMSTTNMKWDPITKTFGASEEDWANYIQAHPAAATYRNKELHLADKLEKLFDGTISIEKKVLPVRHRRKFDRSAVKTECLSRTDELRDAAKVQSACGEQIRSETGMSSSPPAKVKANWTLALHKLFVDACLEQTLMGNKPGSHLTREGWRNIEETFKKVGLTYERKQLKNHWTVTKEQWKIWCKLIATSSMEWDPNTKTFGASEEDWANYIQGNPGAAQYQFNEIPFMDELRTIFNGTEVGVEMEPPSKRTRHDSSVTSQEHGITTVDGRTDNPCDIVESRSPGRNQNMLEIVESKSALTVQSIPQRLSSYSIGECIECLDGMEEVEQGNDLYMFALDIFLKKEHREIFLQLKKPSLRIAWLQRLQTLH